MVGFLEEKKSYSGLLASLCGMFGLAETKEIGKPLLLDFILFMFVQL